MRARVVEVEEVARRAKALSLAPASGRVLPNFEPGSHVKVGVPHLRAGRRAPLSLTGTSRDVKHYQIVVLRTKSCGSVMRWLHGCAAPGDLVDVSEPRCGLPLAPHAARHCLVAGGSGITAFLSHLDQLRETGLDYELHYALRSRAEGICCDALSALHGHRFKLYVSEKGDRLRVDELVAAQTPGSHVYVCGPGRLIQSIVDAAHTARFPRSSIHWDVYGWRPRIAAQEGSSMQFATA